MATAKKDDKGKKKVEKPQDKDNPSLCEISGEIRLRVLEDFFVEKELPKWVRYQKEWKKLREDLGSVYASTSEKEVDEQIARKMSDKSDIEKAEAKKKAMALIAMTKSIEDDRWHIREKHEREVDEAVVKNAKFYRSIRFLDRIRNLLPFGKKVMPVEVAMDDLKDHIELTSTEELTAKLAKLRAIEDNMRKAGQYKKADTVKAYRTILAEEEVVCEAGFQSFVTEETMIDFIRKSERGTAVDFLRYYEDEIPQEVVEKKVAADKLMVFDNYVVAHYSDLINKAVKTEKKVKAEAEKKQREKRRDPILFGLIKNSRKLYYVCDWVTDTDDLTLEKIEKELGVTRGSLVDGASTSDSGRYNSDEGTSGDTGITTVRSGEIRNIVQDAVFDAVEATRYDQAFSRGDNWMVYNSSH